MKEKTLLQRTIDVISSLGNAVGELDFLSHDYTDEDRETIDELLSDIEDRVQLMWDRMHPFEEPTLP